MCCSLNLTVANKINHWEKLQKQTDKLCKAIQIVLKWKWNQILNLIKLNLFGYMRK